MPPDAGATEADMTTIPKILIVDDEPDFRSVVNQFLVEDGYSVSEASNGGEMRDLLSRQDYDLVLLDLAFPEESGVTFLTDLSKKKAMGIIIVSGKGDAEAQVECLDLGADDYLCKPFDRRTLSARIRSVLRRTQPLEEWPPAVNDSAEIPDKVEDGEDSLFVYDPLVRTITRPDGQHVNLTQMENRLLGLLLRSPGRTATREALFASLYQEEMKEGSRAVDVLIARLRQKIDGNSRPWQSIQTVHGVGYTFAEPVRTIPLPDLPVKRQA